MYYLKTNSNELEQKIIRAENVLEEDKDFSIFIKGIEISKTKSTEALTVMLLMLSKEKHETNWKKNIDTNKNNKFAVVDILNNLYAYTQEASGLNPYSTIVIKDMILVQDRLFSLLAEVYILNKLGMEAYRILEATYNKNKLEGYQNVQRMIMRYKNRIAEKLHEKYDNNEEIILTLGKVDNIKNNLRDFNPISLQTFSSFSLYGNLKPL